MKPSATTVVREGRFKGGRSLLSGLIFVTVTTVFADSFLVTLTQTSDPTNLFFFPAKQAIYDPGHPDTFTITNTDLASNSVGGYHFTHWTLNGQRADDLTGQSINPAPAVLTNNISAVAHYVPTNQYTVDSLVPDWYKIQYYSSITNDASSDSDGDGFDLYTEFLRGYHPRLFDEIAEGGISRRRSGSVLVVLDTNYVRVTSTSEPVGLYPKNVQVLLRGSTFSTLPAQPSFVGYEFIGWFVDSNRVDDPQGFSKGTISRIIADETTFIAKFLPTGTDTDHDGLSDGYELYNFNSLTNGPTSDPDGDGFDIATEILRGYSPNAFDQIVEGGISRRRSGSVLVVVDTNYVKVTATSDPFGVYRRDVQVLLRGTTYTNLPAMPSSAGYDFIGWFVDSNRADDPQGFSKGLLSFTITNEMTFLAKFLPTATDNDHDSLSDGYELYNFNSLTNTPVSDPDGDGFDIATEILRGYSPNAFDQIIEGGISRRRSGTFQFVPAPPEFAVQPQDQTAPPGTNVTLGVIPRGIPPFSFQWRLNGINLAGATNQSLTISDAQPTDSGSFSVVVGNAFGFNTSTDAVLRVTSPDLGLADDIENRPTLNSLSGQGSGSNVATTHQPGEPNHAGKFGSNSVWMGWVAPANGIALFTTRGSSFDTVLAVYRRQSASFPVSVTNLVSIASDDDRGGYLTSLVQFNAFAGTEYLIAVDGFVQSSGNIVLSWGLEVTNLELPVITQQPISVTVALGSNAEFSVVATNSLPLSYQWVADGSAIPGATNATLSLPRVEVVNVGNYQVRISNGQAEIVSQVAFLQINITGPDGHAQQVAALEKLADAPLENPPGFAANYPHKGFAALSDVNAIGFSSPPARGFSGTQIYSTLSNSTASAVAWFKLQADSDGPLLVTTEGSDFDTYFTVSSGVSNAVSTAQLTAIAFAYNGGTNYRTRRITFNATSNTVYYIRLDGVNQYGKVWLSWVLGYQSAIQKPSGLQIGHAEFCVPATNSSLQGVQWFFNDALLPGQTNLNLTIASVLSSSEGAYSIQVSNATGRVTRDKVYMHVLPILLSSPQPSSNGTVQLHFGTTYGLPIQIESSSDLSVWTTVYTNGAPATNGNSFSDPQSFSAPARFYRFRFQ